MQHVVALEVPAPAINARYDTIAAETANGVRETMSDQDPRVALPPHARLIGLTFDDTNRTMHADLAGCESERQVAPDLISAFYGARIIEESGPAREFTGGFAQTILTASTWPRSLRPHTTTKSPSEPQLHFALAMRIRDVDELWFLVADSFDFRTALGADAGLVTEANFRTLLRRLTTFAPTASRDAFVAAIVAGQPPPAPLHSLVELFRIGDTWRS